MSSDEEAAIRDRLAKLAVEGRPVEREAVAWQLADYIMRGPVGFNAERRLIERPAPRLRYPIVEATYNKRGTASNEDHRLGAARLMATTLHLGQKSTAVRLDSERNGSHRRKGQPRRGLSSLPLNRAAANSFDLHPRGLPTGLVWRAERFATFSSRR